MNEFYAWFVLQLTNLKQWFLSLFKIGTIDYRSYTHKEFPPISPSSDAAIDVSDEVEQLENKDASDPIEELENATAELNETETQQHVEPLYDGKYDSLFNTSEIPILQSVVNNEIWDEIYKKLPETYTIPSNPSSIIYKKQTPQQ